MAPRINDQGPQITFDVVPHPELQAGHDGMPPPLDASIKVKGSFGIGEDLNHGDQVTVTIANADGTVLAGGTCEIGMPGFAPILHKGTLVGYERVHTAVH